MTKIGISSSSWISITLSIVNSIKSRLPQIRELLPDGASIAVTGDQSVFVKAAVQGVAAEGLIATNFTTLVEEAIEGSWSVRMRMNQNKLVVLTDDLEMLTGNDATIANADVIVGFAPDVNNLFGERIGLSRAMNIAADFE